MGQLMYGNLSTPIEIPDRVLAHLRALATTKLRRGESFSVTWQHPGTQSGGVSTLWLQPAIPLLFVFAAEPGAVDPQVLQAFAGAANSSKGLLLDLDMFGEVSVPVHAVRAA